eukprot:5356112-Pleurochrysis_carterae.AAC.1
MVGSEAVSPLPRTRVDSQRLRVLARIRTACALLPPRRGRRRRRGTTASPTPCCRVARGAARAGAIKRIGGARKHVSG